MIKFVHAWANRSRPQGNDIWRMDCSGTVHAIWQAYPLALSMLMRNRKGCVGVCSYLGPIHQLRSWAQIRSDRPRIWQMVRSGAGTKKTNACSMVALPLRLRDRTRSRSVEFNSGCFGILRLHDRPVCQKAPDEAWHGRQQAAHGLVHDASALSQPSEQGVPQLRGPRHSDLRALDGFCGVLGRHGAYLSRGADDRAGRCKRPLRAGKLHLASFVTAVKEQTPVFGMEL